MPPGVDHPLAATAARADAARDWLTVRFVESVPDGWQRCSDVDAQVVAEWEALVDRCNLERFGRTHGRTSSAYVLQFYADVSAVAGALFFLFDRRVPRLDRESLAFRIYPGDCYVDSIAVLGREFWCLPDDPSAEHPDATVVPDEEALAEVLRREVRRHADEFLASYRPGTRLPRRDLLGSFYDGLDCGFWPPEPSVVPQDACTRAARLTLPGPTPEFPQGTGFYTAVCDDGAEHLTRRRVGCCYYFKVGDDGACTTCPRTSDEERARRMAEAAEQST